ncbi:uncharacterized protein MELLADRAFT_112181 [Melampsora larici-populina 98AG31]|uniref:Uncharacterized protein n=1 Tax=Melampsora larici-populina (strain 98AG31 / pathotype 3-4-7) TaxID=747676 RepID=F4S5M7_MELLP|nr:uncharacterized protein MELLADRAFT_112181 [Melampsora larici-populina 98AG31]EGG00081.1 hypothetical protein MELLADRAFT_112181 [Melampsora larici-populina 98AG31]
MNLLTSRSTPMHIKMRVTNRVRKFFSSTHFNIQVQPKEVSDGSDRPVSPISIATVKSPQEDEVLPSSSEELSTEITTSDKEILSTEITTSDKETQEPEVIGSFSKLLELHGKTLLEAQSSPIDLYPSKRANLPKFSELVWFKTFNFI